MTDAPAAATATDLNPRRWFVLAIMCMSLLIVGLDTTIVNVALPAIHRDLHASLSGLQWVVDAYTLPLASLLMLGGSTADRLGRKRVFRIGLLTFVLGSALCAVAPSLSVLIAARAFQAVGGAMLNPVALSIVRNVFTDPRERAQAVGVWGAMVGLAIGLGPVLGGVFVDTIGWRYVFLVNVPIGLLAWLLTTLYVPRSRAEHARRVDPIGQVLVIVGLATLTYAIIEGQGDGWGSVRIVTMFAIATAALAIFVPYELRRFEPLIEMRFFRSVPFSGASAIAFLAFAIYAGYLLLNTLYLQNVRDYSALHAGLMTLPLAACVVILPPLNGRLVAVRGPRLPLLVASVAMIAGPLLLVGLTPETSLALLFGSYVLLGIGQGMVNAPITNTAISGMPRAQAGVAAGVASTCRQVGATIGIAIAGAIAGSNGSTVASHGFAHATHPGWWMMSGFGVLMLVLAALTTTPRALETARAVRIGHLADSAQRETELAKLEAESTIS